LVLGSGVTIGHQAMLHGCTVDDGALIGIQAVILNGAHIGEKCLVGAGALVTEGKQFAPKSLIIGSPAKVARQLSEEQANGLSHNSNSYLKRGKAFRTQLVRID
jgi:carbonic anhydrase/acetyltransferase-like protein (isoleucine patch superfamily)